MCEFMNGTSITVHFYEIFIYFMPFWKIANVMAIFSMYVFFEVFGDFWKRGWNPVPTPKSLKKSLVVTQNVVALPKTSKKHFKKTQKTNPLQYY